MAMWKQQSPNGAPNSWPEPPRPHMPSHMPSTGQPEPPAATHATRPSQQQSRPDQTTITQGMTVRGEISGPDAIYIDGMVEGQINIPGERVTVGPNGTVAGTSKVPCITAREIVVLGEIRGNIIATDRLEIRSCGSVRGDVTTARLKIEDGSHFQGAIEIHECPPPAETQPMQESFNADDRFPDGDAFDAPRSRRDYAEASF